MLPDSLSIPLSFPLSTAMTEPITFSHLQPDDLRLLCFIAYHGDVMGSVVSSYIARYNLQQSSITASRERLKAEGLLASSTFVAPHVMLDVMDLLATQHQQWLTDFRSILGFIQPLASNAYLWQLSALLRKDDFEAAARLRRPYEGLGHELFNVFPYIQHRASTDSRYLALLDDKQVSDMCLKTMDNLFSQGELDEPTIDNICHIISPRHPQRRLLLDTTDAYRFFITGRYEGDDTRKSLWPVTIRAIRFLYEGQTENALAFFNKALALKSRHATAFDSPLINFLYAICLLRYRGKYGMATATSELSNMLSSTPLRSDRKHFASKILLECGEVAADMKEAEIRRRCEGIMMNADTPLARTFALLLMHFLELPQQHFSSILHTTPVSIILAHELSAYTPVSPKARAEMEALLGGRPLLCSTRRKASWELMLNEISNSVTHQTDNRRRRIIYFLTGTSLTSIVQQVENADGGWEDEKLLSTRILMTEGYETMDITDTTIASRLQARQPWQTDADVLVPLLIDGDRLFRGAEYATQRVAVKTARQQPYIEFRAQADKIAILSNVATDGAGEPRRFTVLPSEVGFTLITLNALQKDILTKLLSRKTLPITAAPTLRRTVESLAGILEVRENVLAGVEDTAYESEGIIAVRIEPVERDYHVSILAAPMADGITRMIPGTGEEYVYDEDLHGNTHCVHRNMAAENGNYMALTDLLEQFGVEFPDYSTCTVESERTLLLLLSFCHDRADRYIVEWPKGQTLKFKGIISKGCIEIDVKSDIDWFSVEGTVKLNDRKLSLEQLIESYKRSSFDGFAQVGDNEYIQLTEALESHIKELDAILSVGERRKRRVPKFLVGALAHALGDLHHSTDKGYSELRERMKQAYSADCPVPSALTATLRPYQEEGFRWLWRLDEWGAGACLADDMGLGKTLQALAFMLSKAERGASLVVAPKSVIPNWVEEVRRFAPTLHSVVLNDARDRAVEVAEAGPATLLLITYGVLTTEAELLASKDWNVVCLDEAHQIKNRNTQVSQAAMSLVARSRLILTGTPLQNHVGELWNLMQFINPGLLGRWSVFRDTYVTPELDEEHREMLHEMTQPFILRRTKQEVLTDLPEKIERTHYVSLTDHEAEVYEEMRRLVATKFKKRKSRAERAEAKELDLKYFEELMKLRQASCDMHLIEQLWSEEGSKVTALMEILDALLEVEDNSVLVFSQFTSFLGIVRKELDKRRIPHLYMDGQTAMKSRQDIVRQFQERKQRLFLSSLKAGGLGINLTAANYVILLDPWWNPAIESQATDRAHRLGQQRCVSVIRMISQGTIEEKILRLHERKQQISDEVLDGTSDSFRLTYEDIMDMVTPF